MHAVYRIEVIFPFCIPGYHVLYGKMRTAVMKEQLLRERKPGS